MLQPYAILNYIKETVSVGLFVDVADFYEINTRGVDP